MCLQYDIFMRLGPTNSLFGPDYKRNRSPILIMPARLQVFFVTVSISSIRKEYDSVPISFAWVRKNVLIFFRKHIFQKFQNYDVGI